MVSGGGYSGVQKPEEVGNNSFIKKKIKLNKR